jgi:hypothetical protein
MKTLCTYTAFIMTFAATLCPSSVYAQQGLNNNAFSFSPQNRASIASLIRQVEKEDTGSASGYAYGGGTTIVCGDGSSTAKGNSSCIVMNNSSGTVTLDQNSEGDQSAETNETSQVVATDESLSDALAELH